MMTELEFNALKMRALNQQKWENKNNKQQINQSKKISINDCYSINEKFKNILIFNNLEELIIVFHSYNIKNKNNQITAKYLSELECDKSNQFDIFCNEINIQGMVKSSLKDIIKRILKE